MTAKSPLPFLLLLATVWSCDGDGGAHTSSTSHWITCSIEDDCADVAGAVECRQGYCVDATGTRIERPASQGGSDAGGRASGGAAPTGGRSASSAGSGGSVPSTGGAATAGATSGDSGAGGGGNAGSTGLSGNAGLAGAAPGEGGTAGEGGEGGAPGALGCPAEPPTPGTPCTQPWEAELRPGVGEQVSAHCSWGDDARRVCRTRALCEEGAWEVTEPDPNACGECPPFVPMDGETCPAAGLQCGLCVCSECAGGLGAPVCQLVDPPEWFCPELPGECPVPAPQAGSPCSVPGAQCGESCATPVRCEAGVWQWLDCSACCPECAAPDTPIATPEGERRIDSLAAGDLVYSVEDGAIVAVPLLRVGSKPARDHHVIRVTLSSGAVLQMSPAHPLAHGGTFGTLEAGSPFDGQHLVLDAELVPYEYSATYDILPDSSTGTYFAAGAEVGSTLSPHAPERPSSCE
jgi:hypothetical protein